MKFVIRQLRKLWKFITYEPPGVYYRGGYLYENTNKPTTPPPLKFKRSKNLNN